MTAYRSIFILVLKIIFPIAQNNSDVKDWKSTAKEVFNLV